MGLAWMSCAVRWSSPDRMEVRGRGVHQPQVSRTEGDHGALCRFGRVLERDVGLHRGWGGQDHPRAEGGLRACGFGGLLLVTRDQGRAHRARGRALVAMAARRLDAGWL